MRRLGIFYFTDEKGIVDSYISNLLTNISNFLDNLIIVCNGTLSPDGRKQFLSFTKHLVVRPNNGFDVYAYKEAIEYFGWDEIYKYDELIFFDYTIMGPIFPFN